MITGKVVDVKRDRGNLNIKVKFFNDDIEIKEEQYYIAENGIEQNVLKEYVRSEINKLKEQVSPISINVDDVIEEDN